MKMSVLIVVVLNLAALFLFGCRQKPDTDVTASSKYNFSSFSGTIWKTKVEVVLVELKHYTGERVLDIVTREDFDPNQPEDGIIPNAKAIAILPVGTCLQIGTLVKDNGNWGGVRVTVTTLNGTNYQKTVYLTDSLLTENQFLKPGGSSSSTWGVNEKMLEKPSSQ